MDLKSKILELQKIRSRQDKLAHEIFSSDSFCQTDIIHVVVQVVSNYFETTRKELIRGATTGNLSTAKSTLYYLCTVYTSLSTIKIGKELFTSDASVCRGKRRINELNTQYKQDMTLYMAVEYMKTQIEKHLMENLTPNLDNEINQNQK